MMTDRRTIDHLRAQQILPELAVEAARTYLESIGNPESARLDTYLRVLKDISPELLKVPVDRWSAIEGTSGFHGLGALSAEEEGTLAASVLKTAFASLARLVQVGRYPAPETVTVVVLGEASRFGLGKAAADQVCVILGGLSDRLVTESLVESGVTTHAWLGALLNRLAKVGPVPAQPARFQATLNATLYYLSEEHAEYFRNNPRSVFLLIDHDRKRAYVDGKIQAFRAEVTRERQDKWGLPYFFLYVLAKNQGRPMTRQEWAGRVDGLVERHYGDASESVFDQALRQIHKTTKDSLKPYIRHEGLGYELDSALPACVLERHFL